MACRQMRISGVQPEPAQGVLVLLCDDMLSPLAVWLRSHNSRPSKFLKRNPEVRLRCNAAFVQ